MTFTRRTFVRGAAFPLLGVLPFSRTAEQNAAGPVITRLILGGDVMLSRHVGRLARARKDPAFPLRDLAPVLQAADIAFVNLESPFSDKGHVVDQGMIFKAEPEMIAALELAGVDIVSTANNHARDQGSHGVEFTLDWLAQHQIAAVGSGKTAEAAHAGMVIERNGIRFGFLAYAYDQSNGNHSDTDDRVAVMDPACLRQDLAAMQARADVMIVSMHAGTEYMTKPNPQQVSFAQAAIDGGACVVVGHHPHVTQSWERRGEGVIFYSLGNLVFDQFQRMDTQRGALAEVIFEGPKMVRANLLPVDIVGTAPRLAGTTPRAESSGGPVTR